MLALGNTHLAVHGFGSSEFGTTFTAAVDLCRDLGPAHVNANRLLGRALFGVWAYKLHVGQLTASRTIAQELLALTRTDEDAQPRVISAIAYGVSCVSLASLKEAARTFAFGAVRREPGARPVTIADVGYDGMCVLHAHWSRAEACQGYAQQAREHVRTGVQMARGLKHLPTLAITISSVCATDWVLRDKRALEARSSELVQLASEQGYESWLSRAKGYVGWIAAVNGRLEEGRYLLAERLAEMRRSGVFLYEPDTRAMLADVHARMGQPDLALAVLDEALAICARTGEVWVEAELHRQKGELLRCDRAAAEACFVMAIDTARRQSAKLYELRSAIGLARLWTAHGQHEEAHALLAPVYAWFTEGFDTPDLTEARELLDELTEPQQREPCCGAVAGTGRLGQIEIAQRRIASALQPRCWPGWLNGPNRGRRSKKPRCHDLVEELIDARKREAQRGFVEAPVAHPLGRFSRCRPRL